MRISEIANEYHRQLLGDSDALDYFHGLGVNTETVEEFRLGCVIEPVEEGHETFHGFPLFPYWNAKGGCTQIRYGAVHFDREGRWDLGVMEHNFPLKGYDLHLYNVGHMLPGLRTNEVVMVTDVESVLLLRQEGMRAVGVPGWQNWQSAWTELLRDSDVTLVTNRDPTEHTEAQSLHGILKKLRVSAKLVVLDHSSVARAMDDMGCKASDVV